MRLTYVDVPHWRCPSCERLHEATGVRLADTLGCNCGWRGVVTGTCNTGCNVENSGSELAVEAIEHKSRRALGGDHG